MLFRGLFITNTFYIFILDYNNLTLWFLWLSQSLKISRNGNNYLIRRLIRLLIFIYNIFRLFPLTLSEGSELFLLRLIERHAILFLYWSECFFMRHTKNILMLQVYRVWNHTYFITFQQTLLIFGELIHRLNTFFRAFLSKLRIYLLARICCYRSSLLFSYQKLGIIIRMMLPLWTLWALISFLMDFGVFFYATLIHYL